MTCKECFSLTGKEKAVKQYNLDGTFVKRFSSVKEASEATKLYPSQISANCRGVVKKAGNYMWRFAEEKKSEEEKKNVKNMIIEDSGSEHEEEDKKEEETVQIIFEEESGSDSDSENETDEKISAIQYETSKTVAQYNQNGDLVKTYKSVAEACRAIGLKNKRSVYGAIRNNFVSHGFVWRYVENGVAIPKIEAVTPHRKYMKKVEIRKDGSVFKNFISIKEAATYMKVNISMCRKFLAGTKEDPKGYVWKFKQE
jgi:hypothetical protein